MTSLLKSYPELRRYIATLPDLKQNQMFQVKVVQRKKHTGEPTKLLRWKFIRAMADIEPTIARLASEEYPDQDNTVLYLNPSPRCGKKAAAMLTKLLVEKAVSNDMGNLDVIRMSLSAMDKANSRGDRVVFDFDGARFRDLQFLQGMINPNAVEGMKTRDGIHVHVTPSLVAPDYRKSWYQAMRVYADRVGDMLSPVPGTLQAGHFVHML